jgi:MFS family permease
MHRTTVVGTSAVVLLSLGGGEDIVSIPLGTFMLGSSVVSFAISPRIFPRWGRKKGFLTGIAIGLVASVLGAISVTLSSPGLYIVSTFFFGMATGGTYGTTRKDLTV